MEETVQEYWLVNKVFEIKQLVTGTRTLEEWIGNIRECYPNAQFRPIEGAELETMKKKITNSEGKLLFEVTGLQDDVPKIVGIILPK